MIRRVLKRRTRSARQVNFAPRLEGMEIRLLLSGDAASVAAVLGTTVPVAAQLGTTLIARPVAAPSAADLAASASTSASTPADASAPAVTAPFTPAEIRHAYGVDQLSSTGAGQTIAIIDAYDAAASPAADLAQFSSTFGLATPSLSIAYYGSGKVLSSAPTTSNSGWGLEIDLDIEWAHSIAPGAKILLVEAATASDADLYGAVSYAVSQGASEVSMSFGGGETNSSSSPYGGTNSGTPSTDSFFNHPGVSFFASSGDSGAEINSPAVSPYVVAVGGTSITLDGSSNKTAETAWSGSGGGVSAYTARPSFQNGFETASNRGVPDVSYDADPGTGIYVYYNNNKRPGYYQVGGTSAGSPQWAGLAALANQGRVANGLSTLGTGTADGLNSVLYALAGGSSYTNPNGDFLDITSGSNTNTKTGLSYSATTGYDNVTGLGSPVANKLIPDLVAYGATTTTGTPAVGDSGFEAINVGAGNFQYDPTGSSWTFGGNAGVSGNNSGFTSGNPAAPQGAQVGFLQQAGSTISQSVAGFAAGSYQVSFQAAERGNNITSAEAIEVLVDGNPVTTITPSGTSYATYTSASFTVGAGSHTITLQGVDPSGADYTAFLDNVAIAVAAAPAPAVGDSGFEAVNVGAGNFQYDPTGSSWTFGGNAGVSGNNSGFTSGNPSAPQGAQVGFLQQAGSTISQSVAGFAAGSYQVSFQAAERGNNITSAEAIEVLVDGNPVTTITPSGTSYATYTSASFTVGAGSHTITLQGVDPSGADYTAFLDNVAIAVAAAPAPAVGDSGFEAINVGAGNFQYDPTGSSWTFGGNAGVSGNNSGFTSGNPAAPQGAQVGFLQQAGSTISQSVAGFAAGNYTLSLQAAQRGNNNTSAEAIEVLVDGVVVTTITPSGTSYATYITPKFTVGAGSHTITLEGVDPSGADYTAFLDNVAIASA